MPDTPALRRLSFYLLGRDEPLSSEFDITELARKVLGGDLVRDVAYTAAKDAVAASGMLSEGARKAWAKKRKIREDLTVLKVPEAQAYGLYREGVTDQTAHELESEILEDIESMILDDEGELADPDGEEEEEEEEEDGDDEPTAAVQ